MLEKTLQKKLVLFASEDIAGQDITSFLLSPKKSFAVVVCREPCVLSGAEEAGFLFRRFGVKTVFCAKDGSKIKQNAVVLKVFGSNTKILSLERTVLNVLARMSGVATICSKAGKIAKNKTKIFLTRKTVPGFNLFDKKAAVAGGVFPHRKNLRESILIKENHLKFESIPVLLKKALLKKKALCAKEIEIEVSSQKEAILAVRNGAQVVLLDNFSAKNARKAIREIRKISPKTKIELSGGINLKNLKKYVILGADRISMGVLSRKARMVDFSLDFL